MLNFFSGYSKEVNPKKAVKEAMGQAMMDVKEDVTLVILNISSGYSHLQIVETIYEITPNTSIIGTTCSGVISNGFVNETLRALAVTVVTGSEFCVSKIADVSSKRSYELSKSCAEELKSQSDDINMVMVFSPGIISNGEAIVEGFTDVFTDDVPLLGGLSGFSGSDSSKMFLFFNKEILTKSIVALGFCDKTLSCVQASHHGYIASENEFIITKADGEYIVELDYEPAWYKIMDKYELPRDTTPLEAITVLALGIKLDSRSSKQYKNTHILTAPLVIREDGAMLVQTNVSITSKITICVKDEDYLMSSVDNLNKRVVSQYLEKKPVAVFQADCAARGRLSLDIIDKQEIITNLQNGVIADSTVPWLGMYAFGEFARLNGKNHHHNYTSTISVLLR